MDAATKQRLIDGAAQLGVVLDEGHVTRLVRLLELLSTWNTRINLTAVTEPAAVVERHFLDSLSLVPMLRSASTLVDVGAGAGFPGSVIAIARPELRVTCVESIRKKVAFLQALRREVAPNLEPVCARVEDFRATGRTFDAAVSRATWEPARWLAEGAPLVAPGGLLIAMQGAVQPPLDPPSGFSPLPVVDYSLEGGSRRLVPFFRST
jgi:16S rRNA (guanine527-N7)-methyltransferase